MRRLLWVMAFAVAAVCAVTAGRAARNDNAMALPGEALELVVFEVEGCVYCTVFRRDVMPSYQLSDQARNVPLRFVDLNDPAADRFGLDGGISMVPTAVLLKGNREVGRIPGYTGPESFFLLLKNLLSQAG